MFLVIEICIDTANIVFDQSDYSHNFSCIPITKWTNPPTSVIIKSRFKTKSSKIYLAQNCRISAVIWISLNEIRLKEFPNSKKL